MKTSVIIPTYKAEHELDLCLTGIARQSHPPDEILIADDGSDKKTKEVVDKWKIQFGTKLKHVWHDDIGNRKAVICNQAVRESSGQWLLFIDGDSIPHSQWIEDHLIASHRADVCCGRRVKLGPAISKVVNEEFINDGKLELRRGAIADSAQTGDTKRFNLGRRYPMWLVRLLNPRPRKLMGVNFSLSREAFYAVNGYDEEWQHRRQDKDLDLRLLRAGFRFFPLINRAVVYHLYHLERKPNKDTQSRVAQEASSHRIRCDVGLDKLESQS